MYISILILKNKYTHPLHISDGKNHGDRTKLHGNTAHDETFFNISNRWRLGNPARQIWSGLVWSGLVWSGSEHDDDE
jgi:hypothetical protein